MHVDTAGPVKIARGAWVSFFGWPAPDLCFYVDNYPRYLQIARVVVNVCQRKTQPTPSTHKGVLRGWVGWRPWRAWRSWRPGAHVNVKALAHSITYPLDKKGTRGVYLSFFAS